MIRPPNANIASPRLSLILACILGAFLFCVPVWADTFKITAYCSCFSCCGKSDGITASGLPARQGYIALNWLPFGTKVNIEGMGIYSVQDRGARSLFGSKKNKIRHIDVWFPSHRDALKFGVQYKNVEIL